MISIIIPTFNENDVLKDCVESLSNQSILGFEIVVIDDGSTDGTLKSLKSFKKNLPNFRFVKQSHLGPGAARNTGARLAKGNILVFVDADMTFHKNFIEKLTKPIITSLVQNMGKVKGTFSKEEYVENWDNIWARCWNFNQGWEEKKRHPVNYPDTQPVFRAILKSEFDKVRGFSPGGYDDDWSLYRKLGYDAINAPGAIFYHKNPSSIKEVYYHAKWVGKRTYKFGILGYLVALVRSSFPLSLVVGIYKAFIFKLLAFVYFKIIYDFAVVVGIIEILLSRKYSK